MMVFTESLLTWVSREILPDTHIKYIKYLMDSTNQKSNGAKETPVKKFQQGKKIQSELCIYQSGDQVKKDLDLLYQLGARNSCLAQKCPEQEMHNHVGLEEYSQSQPPSESYLSVQEVPGILENIYMTTNPPQKPQKKPPKASKQRGCTCKKSRCLKNYCQCFASGRPCIPNVCKCLNCGNQSQKKEKITGNQVKIQTKTGQKGCNCRQSRCLKNYCQCFFNNRKCGPLCQCNKCENQQENCMHLQSKHGKQNSQNHRKN